MPKPRRLRRFSISDARFALFNIKRDIASGSAILPERTPAMSRILSENIIVPYKTTKTTIAARNNRGLSLLVFLSNWIVLRKFLCTCDPGLFNALWSIPFSNGIEEFEGQRQTKDSLGRKSLNLCEATKSFGGCLEVIRTFPLAARDNSRSAARRRQTLPTAACPTAFHFRDCERCRLVSRHPHLHQGPSATAEQSL